MRVRHSKAKGVKVMRQRYCGPAALSALLGVTVERAAAEINRYRGVKTTKVVKGSWPVELSHAARVLGFNLLPVDGAYGKTVTQILKEVDRSKRYLVYTSHHYIALKGNFAYDNHRLLGWKIRRVGALFRRGKIRGLYLVERIPETARAEYVESARNFALSSRPR